jgi:hypothetical protein
MNKPTCALCGNLLQETDIIEEGRVIQRIYGAQVTTDRPNPRVFKHFYQCPPPPPESRYT